MRGQRGQALLLVLVFMAAFLLLAWAGLTLASGAFLSQASVQQDTRETYALDAGLAYGIEALDLKRGNGCNAPGAVPPLVLAYPSGAITVNVAIVKGNPCRGNGATFSVTVTASGTSRTLSAQITQANNAITIPWEAFQ